MLPDLRIVIAAVVSTFICTVGVGFYASTRLLQEPLLARPDPHDDTPINRIALNWPEPVQIDRSLSLDFAVTAKAAKNPVRDVTSETSPTQAEAIAKLAAGTAQRPAPPAPAESTPAPGIAGADSAGEKPAEAVSDKVALPAIPLVEPDPHRLIVPEKVAIAPSLVEPDPHRFSADPQITGSVTETPQPMTPREALQKAASRPDSADPQPDEGAADAATTGEQPPVRVHIVKEPTAGKPRAKRRPRVAATNTTTATNPAVKSLIDWQKQLQFPFYWFQIPQL